MAAQDQGRLHQPCYCGAQQIQAARFPWCLNPIVTPTMCNLSSYLSACLPLKPTALVHYHYPC